MTLIIDSGYTWDTDALDYVQRVNAADAAAGQTGGLESGVEDAIDAFVKGCKADGIWYALRASCILAGARTLSGALVPIAGAAPTNIGLSNYDRKTGLRGTGSGSHRFTTNYTIPATNQNNVHGGAWVTEQMNPFGNIIFGNSNGDSFGVYPSGANSYIIAINSATASTINQTGIGNSTGYTGISRQSGSTANWSIGASNNTVTAASAVPLSNPVTIFSGTNYGSNARVAFYSFGEFLDISLLGLRVSTLITAIGAAIP